MQSADVTVKNAACDIESSRNSNHGQENGLLTVGKQLTCAFVLGATMFLGLDMSAHLSKRQHKTHATVLLALCNTRREHRNNFTVVHALQENDPGFQYDSIQRKP